MSMRGRHGDPDGEHEPPAPGRQLSDAIEQPPHATARVYGVGNGAFRQAGTALATVGPWPSG
jgi:hypothetical protein